MGAERSTPATVWIMTAIAAELLEAQETLAPARWAGARLADRAVI
jgi:hypothetical protein